MFKLYLFNFCFVSGAFYICIRLNFQYIWPGFSNFIFIVEFLSNIAHTFCGNLRKKFKFCDISFFVTIECAGCDDDIKSGQALLALDKQWHLWCFTCNKCGCLLAGEYMGRYVKYYQISLIQYTILLNLDVFLLFCFCSCLFNKII